MKKSTVIILLSLVVVLFLTCVTVFAQTAKQLSAAQTSIKVYKDDVRLSFDSPIVLIDGKTYVPLRDLCESLGMNVEWNGDEQKVNLVNNNQEKNDKIISIFIHPLVVDIFAYKIDLFANGRITTSVGEIARMPKDGGENNFTAKVVKQKILSDVELKELKELIEKMNTSEDSKNPPDLPHTGGWLSSIQYQNSIDVYPYLVNYSREINNKRAYAYLLVISLVSHSPIEIVTFSYENPDTYEKYVNRDDW